MVGVLGTVDRDFGGFGGLAEGLLRHVAMF